MKTASSQSAFCPERDMPVSIRLGNALHRLIDKWRRSEPDLPSRAEAIRRLIKRGLESKNK
jgi:Arc/MetJ-type ribon-helix-helix transcriptional regulator